LIDKNARLQRFEDGAFFLVIGFQLSLPRKVQKRQV
jgi:hypothetical protein